MPHRYKNRLSYKIVGSVAVIALAVLIAVGGIISFVVGKTVMSSEKQKAELLLKTVEKPVQIAMYLKFYDQLGQKVAPVTTLADVMEMKIFDREGKLLFIYANQVGSAEVNDPIVVVHQLDDPTAQEPLGLMTLRYSDRIYRETLQSLNHILYGVGGAVVVIFFLAAWWVRHLLLPLTNIAQKVRHYKPGDIVAFDEDGDAEIDQIVTAFESMQEMTHTYLEQIESMNATLEVAVDEKTRQLEEQYYTDRLTGLANRYRLQEKLARGKATALAIFNLDDFKEINDFFGIDIADELLVQIGAWLDELSGPCYRLGGDEFALAIYDPIGQAQIEHRLLTILSLLEEKAFVIDEESLRVRATIGVALGSDKVLTRADIALHHAKQTKKRIAFYEQSDGIEELYHANLAMAAAVRRALVERRIVCFYQPIVNLETGETEKYETLVRMIAPDGTVIPPLDFLHIAKKTKLYPHITQEVVWQACSFFSGRREEFSINLSSSDILDRQTVDIIEQTVRQTGTGKRIIFEILESEGIENYDEVRRFIGRVKALGAKIAIDDFGTGYSNFENILRLNVDTIKIDGSLIRSIDSNPRHRIVVETIVSFAHRIGASTVAEFVSSPELVTQAKSLGITFGQGYYFGKPAPLE